MKILAGQVHFVKEYGTIRFMCRMATLVLAIVILLAACEPSSVPSSSVAWTVTVKDDGAKTSLTTDGHVVRDVLTDLNIQIGDLDRVSPSEFTPLTDGLEIQIVRVIEQFVSENDVIPFEKQIVRNEGLPAGDTRLLQTGVSGLEEITYRIVSEDGQEVSRAVIRRTVVADSVPEIIMVGAQTPFTVIPIEGSLAYLSAGNAWVMRGSSGNRKPITIAGDLDGRVFHLSGDGHHLLYTSNVSEDNRLSDSFNSLWVISTGEGTLKPVNLSVGNILWAEWSPTIDRTVAYSTGEPRATAPGWQANNDLHLISFDEEGVIVNASTTILEPSAGGIYGWYGTRFSWSPDGEQLAFSQADGVGLIDVNHPGSLGERSVISFPPYQTYSDWVWMPDVTWSPDGRFLYSVVHGDPVGLEMSEDSPVFDLAVLDVEGGFQAVLASRAGMWAYPVISSSDGPEFKVAYLQALNPLASVNSTYRLTLMDRDGSNASMLFPPDGEFGLAPQMVSWSPDEMHIALIFDGNLWVVEVNDGMAQQLTGDGQTSVPSWSH